jgi:hypothetical protein
MPIADTPSWTVNWPALVELARGSLAVCDVVHTWGQKTFVLMSVQSSRKFAFVPANIRRFLERCAAFSIQYGVLGQNEDSVNRLLRGKEGNRSPVHPGGGGRQNQGINPTIQAPASGRYEMFVPRFLALSPMPMTS